MSAVGVHLTCGSLRTIQTDDVAPKPRDPLSLNGGESIVNATVLIRRTLVVLASLFLTTPAWSLSFTVVNNSDEGIILVYATPSYHNTFGNNLLEELNTIRPGDELAFSVDLYGDHCTFDIFIGASLINREVYNSVNICKTTHVYFPSAERYKTARQSFTVVNAHDAEVMSIHVSRTDETVWGEDRLGVISQ